MIEANKLPIHPTWQQAIDESRAGLATYPITGAGFNLEMVGVPCNCIYKIN